MAELIQRDDSLNTGREKLNEAIKASDRAEGKSDTAVRTANSAKSTADTTREEMVEIIREQTSGGDIIPEVVQARGGQPVLADRLNSVDSQLAQTATKKELENAVIPKADKTYVDSSYLNLDTKVNAMASGTPKIVVQSIQDLPPVGGTEKLALVLDNGHKYYDNGSEWVDAGVYESKEIESKGVKGRHIDNTAIARSLLNGGSTKRINSGIANNTVVSPGSLVQSNFYTDKDIKIENGKTYQFYFKTNLFDGTKVNSFRINARDKLNAILETITSQYLGDGIFAILDLDITTAYRLQLIANNDTTSNMTIYEVVVAEGNYYLGDIKFRDSNLDDSAIFKVLSSGTTDRVLSDTVYLNDTTKTIDTGKTLEDSFVLPNNHYIYTDLTSLEVGKKYDFIIDTNNDIESIAPMFRLSQGEDRYNSVYLGGGRFGILNFEVFQDTSYRFIAWNESGKEITINKVLIGKDGFPIDSPLTKVKYEGQVENYSLLEVKKSTDGKETIQAHDPYKYPLYPVWGHEYLYSWYDKIMNNAPLKMVWAGDSTTLNSGIDQNYTRSNLARKIMLRGNYPSELITSINAGHGTQHTGNWLGGDKDEDKRTPNGFLYDDMQENPDLYVIAYGVNDGSDGHFPNLSWQERIDRFEENMREGLERIRGSMYNKSPDDMAIILCTPISTNGSGNQSPQNWGDRIRPIIQQLCREYKCAFVDVLARQYDHAFSSSWSTEGDFVHPLATANADYMSMFADLLFPYLLHKD